MTKKLFFRGNIMKDFKDILKELDWDETKTVDENYHQIGDVLTMFAGILQKNYAISTKRDFTAQMDKKLCAIFEEHPLLMTKNSHFILEENPGMWCVELGLKKSLNYVLEKSLTAVLQQDYIGCNIGIKCAQTRLREETGKVLKNYSKACTQQNVWGENIGMICAENGWLEETLLALENSKARIQRNQNNHTILDVALQNELDIPQQLIEKYKKEEKKLMDKSSEIIDYINSKKTASINKNDKVIKGEETSTQPLDINFNRSQGDNPRIKKVGSEPKENKNPNVPKISKFKQDSRENVR